MESSCFLDEYIIHMHGDLDPYVSIGVGFSDNIELVVGMTYVSWGQQCLGDSMVKYDKLIIIADKDDLVKLAHCLHTTLAGIPKAMAKEFGRRGEVWRKSEVFDVFNEILNYLSVLDINFKTKMVYR